MLKVIYAECRYVECRYAECRYAECRSAKNRLTCVEKYQHVILPQQQTVPRCRFHKTFFSVITPLAA